MRRRGAKPLVSGEKRRIDEEQPRRTPPYVLDIHALARTLRTANPTLSAL
jgi:hypothetical protein